MRTEEKPIFNTMPAFIEGQVEYEGFKRSEVMVIQLGHPDGSLHPRPGGWTYCLRCNRYFQPRKAKRNSRLISIRGTFQIIHGKIVLRIPRGRAKKGHCQTCGRILNDKGEK